MKAPNRNVRQKMSDNKGNGQTITAVMSVSMLALAGLGSVVWWSMTSQAAQQQRAIDALALRQDQVIAALTTRMEGEFSSTIKDTSLQFVRKEELGRIDERYSYIDREIGDIKNRLTRMSDQNLAAQNHLGDKYLTKDSYAGQHQALIEQVNRLQDRHNELRQDVAKFVTPTDFFKLIDDRLKAVESVLRNPKQTPSSTP